MWVNVRCDGRQDVGTNDERGLAKDGLARVTDKCLVTQGITRGEGAGNCKYGNGEMPLRRSLTQCICVRVYIHVCVRTYSYLSKYCSTSNVSLTVKFFSLMT